MRSERPELARPLERCFRLFGHPCRLFLGPGFRLAARWNRLGEAVKTHKKREKTGKKWARYGRKGVKESGSPDQAVENLVWREPLAILDRLQVERLHRSLAAPEGLLLRDTGVRDPILRWWHVPRLSKDSKRNQIEKA